MLAHQLIYNCNVKIQIQILCHKKITYLSINLYIYSLKPSRPKAKHSLQEFGVLISTFQPGNTVINVCVIMCNLSF